MTETMRTNCRILQALLWACCSPNDFGAPEVSPLGEAIGQGTAWLCLCFCTTELIQHDERTEATTQFSWQFKNAQLNLSSFSCTIGQAHGHVRLFLRLMAACAVDAIV